MLVKKRYNSRTLLEVFGFSNGIFFCNVLSQSICIQMGKTLSNEVYLNVNYH